MTIMAGRLCDNFMETRPGRGGGAGSYSPLRCKPVVVTTRGITGRTRRANASQLFYLTKANTIRERATLDLLYPSPSWLVRELQPPALVFDRRVTSTGETRITEEGDVRVLHFDSSLVRTQQRGGRR